MGCGLEFPGTKLFKGVFIEFKRMLPQKKIVSGLFGMVFELKWSAHICFEQTHQKKEHPPTSVLMVVGPGFTRAFFFCLLFPTQSFS